MKKNNIYILICAIAVIGTIITYLITTNLEKEKEEAIVKDAHTCAKNVILAHNTLDAMKLEYGIKEGQEIINLELKVIEYAKRRGNTITLKCPTSGNILTSKTIINKKEAQFECSNKTHAMGIKIVED